MKKFIDTDHPMLRPLWVRILLVAICLGWAVFEFTARLAGLGHRSSSPSASMPPGPSSWRRPTSPEPGVARRQE